MRHRSIPFNVGPSIFILIPDTFPILDKCPSSSDDSFEMIGADDDFPAFLTQLLGFFICLVAGDRNGGL
jgi:hypothetical protein